ncbi:MAG: TIGR04282 family arsenosugar biosynthesis glycosyltransferase [Hyphomicrobiaceae bacterium]
MSRPSSDPRAACAIAVMAKASAPGRTKTRLVPPLSPEQAAALNTAFLRDIAAGLLRAGRLAPISPWMAYAPAGSAAFFRSILPAEINLLETARANFGDCLAHAIAALLDAGHPSACVLNSDSPTLPTAYLLAATVALAADGDRMVIGPSTDGGYYLLGLKTLHRRVFEDIDWSTERVFAQSIARAGEIGLPVVVLPTWYDVDEADSLALLEREVLDGKPFRVGVSSASSCEWTRAELVRFADSGSLPGHRVSDTLDARVA